MKKLNKKILLGTTALFASALIATVAEAKPKLDIGGYVRFEAGFFDDKHSNTNNRDFQTESQIAFKAKGVAQNGLEYGAEVYLNASTDDTLNSDVVFIWMENRCGRLELGDRDGAADKTAYYTKRIGFGQAVDGDYEDWLDVNSRSSVGPKAMDSAESTKITVYMPRMYGFQAGLSYAPEFDKGEGVLRSKIQATGVTAGARDYVNPADATVLNGLAGNKNKQEEYLKGNVKDIIELGANYITKFDDVELRLSAAYVWGEDKTPGTVAADKAGDRRDINAWHVGGQVEWMGWTLGGGYVDNGKSAQARRDQTGAVLHKADRNAWNVGLAYENGPWAVSANALFEDLGGSSKDGKYTSYGFGGQYYLAPGIKVAADLVMFERKFHVGQTPATLTGGKHKDKGYVGIVGTQLDF